MHLFQDMFDEVLEDETSFPVVFTRLCRKQLKKAGINLTDDQVEQLKSVLARLEKDGKLGNNLTIVLGDDGRVSTSIEADDSDIVINLDDTLDEELTEVVKNIEEKIPDIADDIAIGLLKTLKRDAGRMLREHASIQHGFERRLYRRWKKPLRLMEMFLVIAEEAGSEFNHYICTTTDISKSYKFEVLRRLHARACQVSKEIMTLLKSGFADGAHARWRTLHEISVVASLIADNNDQLAERYLLHEPVERYQFARIYQEHCDRLGFERIPAEEIDELRNVVEGLTKRFGLEFKEEYGWAAEVVGKKKPNFTDLEMKIDLSHYRPYYKFACLNVHAGPRGIIHRLGLSEEDKNTILLSGSSDIGLADPGQNMIYSLMITTMNLLCYETNLDCLVVMNILSKLSLEILAALDQPEFLCR